MKTRTLVPALLLLALAAAACEEQKSTSTTPSATASASTPSVAASSAPSAAASAAPAAAPTPTYDPAAFDLDTAHTRVGFSVRHMMVSTTRGDFKKYSGTVFIDEKDLAKSVVDISVDTDSIDTGDKKRDTHLRSPDFFDSKKWPSMTFKSTAVDRKPGGGYAVTGNLTIRDKTKPVTLDVEPLSPETKSPWGTVNRGTHATAKINRTDFDLKWNKALESGGMLVSEEVTIDLEIELIKKADKK
jgi:polyisoprenoid-binding protein YceI